MQSQTMKQVETESDKRKSKKFEQSSEKLDASAEVIRDEFGGYCCKRWGLDKD